MRSVNDASGRGLLGDEGQSANSYNMRQLQRSHLLFDNAIK